MEPASQLQSRSHPPTPDHERRFMSDRTPTVSRFDLRASTYEDSVLQQFLFVPVHQTALRLGRQILPQAGAVLDVGCGTGRLLRAARPCYPAAELAGVDLAGQMVATATAVTPSGLRIRYVQARAERLPFPDARFDLVFATMALRHWADPPVGMAEVARVLRPTGTLVLADVFRDCPRRDPWVRVLRRRQCSLAPAELVPLLARQRLEVAGLERVHWFGLPDVQVLGLQPIHRRAMPVRSGV
jgi:SAM-dependent methyltransferase